MAPRATAVTLSLLLAAPPGLPAFAQSADPLDDPSWTQAPLQARGVADEMPQPLQNLSNVEEGPNMRGRTYKALMSFDKLFAESRSAEAEIQKLEGRSADHLRQVPPSMRAALSRIRQELSDAAEDRQTCEKLTSDFEDDLSASPRRSRAQGQDPGADQELDQKIRKFEKALYPRYKDLRAQLRALASDTETVRDEAAKLRKASQAQSARAEASMAQGPAFSSASQGRQSQISQASRLANSGDTRGAHALLAQALDGSQGHADMDIDATGRLYHHEDPTAQPNPQPKGLHLIAPPPPSLNRVETGTSSSMLPESTEKKSWWQRTIEDAKSITYAKVDSSMGLLPEENEIALQGMKYGAEAGAAVGLAGGALGGAWACGPGCAVGGSAVSTPIGAGSGAYVGGVFAVWLHRSAEDVSKLGINAWGQ